jgi:hypothetical protein
MPSKTKPIISLCEILDARRDAAHPRRMGSMAFWKIFVPHVLRTGAAQKIQGARKLHKSAPKLLKELARVTLCAPQRQESEADDSR